jgi:sensor histidine kinase regulating citrate/malate metabolism
MKSTRRFLKALVFLVLLFGVTTLPMTILSGWLVDRNLTAQFASRGRAIARGLASSSTDVFLFRDLSTVHSMIDQFMDIEGVAYVLVVSPQGVVLAHTFVPEVPAEIRGLRGDRHEETVQDVAIAGLGDYINVSAPILDGEVGYVHVGMDRQRIRAAVWSAVGEQTLLICLLFPLGAWGAYFFLGTDEARQQTGVQSSWLLMTLSL